MRSFRAQLTLWNGLVIAVVLVAFSIGVVWSNQTRLAGEVDRELIDRAVLSPPMGPPPGPPQSRRGPPPDAMIPERFSDPEAIRFADLRRPRRFDFQGEPVGAIPDLPFDAQAVRRAQSGWSGFSDGWFEEQPIRIYTVRLARAGAIVQVASDTTRLRQIWSAQLWTLAILLPFAVLGAAAGASFLTRRATTPLMKLRQAASAIDEADLSQRLEIRGHDEFAELGATFNAMLARLEDSFERRRIAFAELERAHELQKRFTADASHELRTPLTRLRLATSSALASDARPEDRLHALQVADAAARSMAKLVSEMLVLARADAGELGLQRAPVDLRTLASDVLQEYRPDRIELRVPDQPVMAEVDPDQIRRVLANLLENAIRHTPGGKRIWVEVAPGPLMQVGDEGEGVASEHLPHLTERFYRADGSRARDEGGVGLGLAICKTIVEAHGGTMTIESELGGGTLVTLILETPISKQNPHTISG